jgi:hypothetical protein
MGRYLDDSNLASSRGVVAVCGRLIDPVILSRCDETPAKQGFLMERTTGFEPATLTLARSWLSSD